MPRTHSKPCSRRAELIYRQPRDRQELLGLFRLRHRAYRDTPLERFEPPSSRGYHVDRWDPISFHFGLYARGPARDRPIAYHRLVPEHRELALRGLTRGLRDARAWLDSDDASPSGLPFAEYWPLRLVGRRLEHVRPRRDEGMLEATRLSVAPGSKDRRAVFTVMAGTLTVSFCILGVAGGVTIVSAHHAALYRRFGFTTGSRYRFDEPLGEAEVMVVSSSRFLEYHVDRMEQAAAEFRRTGEIVDPPIEILAPPRRSAGDRRAGATEARLAS